MAFVYETKSESTNTSTPAVPSGTTEGDLLVACVTGNDGIYGSSGFTEAVAGTAQSCSIGWKIATSGDETAGTFTFSSSVYRADILRFSGAASSSTTSTFLDTASANESSISDPTTDTITLTESYNTQSRDVLLIALVGYGIAASNIAQGSLTNPSITGLSSSSFTSLVYARNNQGDPWTRVAYSITDEDGTYTGYTVDYVNDGSGAGANLSVLSAAFVAQADGTGTHTHLAVTPTFHAPAGRAGTTATHSHLAVSPTLNKPTASATGNTAWTNESKPSTTSWTIENY